MAASALLKIGTSLANEYGEYSWTKPKLLARTEALIKLTSQVQAGIYDYIENKAVCARCKAKYEK